MNSLRRLLRYSTAALLAATLTYATHAVAQYAPSTSAHAISTSQISVSTSTDEGYTVRTYRWTSGGSHVPIHDASWGGWGSTVSFTDSGRNPNTTYFYCSALGVEDEVGNFIASTGCGTTVSATTFGPPAAPSGLSATGVSGSQINLSWADHAGNESSFLIERKTGAGGAYSQVASVAANATSYSNTALSADTAYYYRVRAANAYGTSGYTNESGASTVPNAPGNLLGTPESASQINLVWSDTSATETGFKIERKIGVTGTYAQIALAAANATSFDDTGLSATTAYYYRVRSTNGAGDSASSNEILITTLTPPDGTPGGLNAAPISSTRITIAWADTSTNETGFRIERKAGLGGTYAEIGVAGVDATSYTDGSLSAGTAYYYRVRATNSGGNSPYSNEATATTGPVANATSGTITYTYDALGNLVETNAGGVVTTVTYDLRGRKVDMTDPDMGHWTYAYNALGELVSQTDALGKVTTMQYDALGRMIQRSDDDLISTWSFDACPKGIGKLCQASAGDDYQRTQSYDAFGRPSGLTVTIDTSYTVTTNYDSAGRVDAVTYPDGFAVKNVYNAYGYLAEVRNNADLSLFWQADGVSASGKVTEEMLGNGLTATRSYDVLDRLTGQSASGPGGTVQSNSYAYDAIGNLTQRTDAVHGVSEYFYYDSLNRLLASSGPNLVSRSYEYDALGNITYKSDVGSYTYGTKPHAVASVAGTVNASYQYDANGNLISGAGRTLTYMSFNLPHVISQGGNSWEYTYDAEHQRARVVVSRPTGATTIIYLHPGGAGSLLYEKETAPDGTVEHRHYVTGGAGLVGSYVTKSAYGQGDGPGMRYYHMDHLGSIQSISNDAGATLEPLAYEPYGKRRFPDGTADPANTLIGLTTERGFTGHEHLDELGLIHMNGRVYDPLLGRFMTADPTLQFPANLQSYNRYSYALNNPLIFVDPSGFNIWKKLKHKVHRAAHAASRFINGLNESVYDGVTAFMEAGGPMIVAAAYFAAPLLGDMLAASQANWAIASSWGASEFGAAGYTLTTAGSAAVGAGAGFTLTLTAGGDLHSALYGAIGGGFSAFAGLGQMIGSGINGYMQTGTSTGFIRGFAAGAIPNDLGFTNAYLNNPVANVSIGIVRDGIRGGVVGGRDAALRGIEIGQFNNAFGHLVGWSLNGFNRPEFIKGEGAFLYGRQIFADEGAITFGNVISGAGVTGDVLAHEIAHTRQYYLGGLYIPAHAASLTVSGLTGVVRGEGFYAGTHNKFNLLECSPSFISFPHGAVNSSTCR